MNRWDLFRRVPREPSAVASGALRIVLMLGGLRKFFPCWTIALNDEIHGVINVNEA
jgi:hypothetical protein